MLRSLGESVSFIFKKQPATRDKQQFGACVSPRLKSKYHLKLYQVLVAHRKYSIANW